MNEITDRMKKYLFFLSAVIMAMFTACSSGDDLAAAPELTQAEKDAAIIAEAISPSDVQIRLGMGSQSSSTEITRAPLESDANGLFETPANSYLGIFCLAQQNQTTTGALPVGSVATESIDWSSTDADTKFFLMAQNQAAKVVKVGPGGTLGNVTLGTGVYASEVQFMKGDLSNTQIYYYPYGNWYNYYFYGYYPRQTTGINYASGKITVDFDIDGTQDIIHGTAKPAAAYLATGFNAKYLRTLQKLTDAAHNGKNALEDLPNLAMDHKLTQVRFWVKTTSSNYTIYGYAPSTVANKKRFQISELKLTQVPTKWTLTVADKATSNNTEGQLAPQSSGLGLANITPKVMALLGDGKTADPDNTSNDEALEDPMDIPLTTPQLVGYAMIPTTEMMENSLVTIPDRADKTIPLFDFTISYTDANNSSSTFEFKNQKIDKPRTAGNDGVLGTSDDVILDFEPGKVYNVIIDIPVPEEIDMTATLEQWATVTVTEDSPQNISVNVD